MHKTTHNGVVRRPAAAAVVPLVLMLAAGASCGDDESAAAGSTTDAATTNAATMGAATTGQATSQDAGVDSSDGGPRPDLPAGCEAVGEGPRPEQFLEGSLASEVTEEPCTLGNGTETLCYRIEIIGEPVNHDVGPYCPRSIDDGPEDAGLWPEGGTLHDVDGEFVTNLATFYDDPNWQLFDPMTGDVYVTDTAESCLAAAMPNAPEEYANYCVECTLDDVGGPVVIEYLIPIVPVPSDTPTELEEIPPGVALNGVRIEFPANTGIILEAYNLGPLDDCGGHVNNAIGYHYHESTGCAATVEQCDAHAPLIGYAQDGYAIHTMTGDDGEEATDLDQCRGHTDAVRGYHYHAASPGENMFIGCFRGELVEGGNGGGGGGPGGGGPDGGGPP